MKVQGSNILHALDYLKRKKGSDGLALLSEKLDFKIDEIKKESWHPFEWYMQVMEEISKIVIKTGYTIPARIGYQRAQNVGFLKDNKELLTPEWVLMRVQKNWTWFYDFGQIKIVSKKDNVLEFQLLDYESNSIFCERMNGFLKGLMREVCLEKDAIIEEIKCQSDEGTGCIFLISW